MTWTHNITGTESQDGALIRILIDYTDDQNNVQHDSLYVNASAYNLPWLQNQILIRLANLNAGSSISIPTGTIDLTLPSVPTPSQVFSTVQSVVAAQGSSDTVYVITTSKVLHFLETSCGSAVTSNKGIKVEFFSDPNGNGTGMALLNAAYLNGSNFSQPENFITSSGNGTVSVRIRRTNYSDVPVEIFAHWEGYEI